MLQRFDTADAWIALVVLVVIRGEESAVDSLEIAELDWTEIPIGIKSSVIRKLYILWSISSEFVCNE